MMQGSIDLKRITAVILVIAFALTGCMMEKQDYSDVISYQCLVTIDPDAGNPASDVSVTTSPGENNGTDDNNGISASDENNVTDDETAVTDLSDEDTTAGDDTDSNGYVADTGDSDTTDKHDGAVNDVPDQGDDESVDTGSTIEYAKNRIEKNDSDSVNGKKKEEDKDKKEEKDDSKDTEEDGKKDKSDDSDNKKKKSDDSEDKKDKDSSKNKNKDKAFDVSKIDVDFDNFDRLAPSTTMEFSELVGDNGIYGLPEGFAEPGTYRIVVDLYHQLVMAFSKDENGEYTVPVRFMLCSSGANATQSPTGTFKMRNYRVRFALFNNTTSYAQYWSLITGRIYFHSILYSARDAAKYTESYKRLGTNVSHGCIRLTVPDARWIWYNCAPETVVEIRRGSKSEKLLGKIRDRMILASYPSERLKLKAGKIPNTDLWSIEDVPHDVGFVQGSQ